MALSHANCEALWICKLLVNLFGQELRPTVIYCNNQSCIQCSENPVFHDQSKHIEIRYHFIRDYVRRGAVTLQYIVGCIGQTRVYYHVPTTPLAHWPFRQQTAERPEVSLEVILMGWPKTQVSRPGSVWHPVCISQLFLAREMSLSSLRCAVSSYSR